MKRILLTLLFLAGFCYIPEAAAQTSATGRIVVGLAATKPATCVAGDTFIASDTPYMYVCGPANTWTPLLFGGLATTQVAFGSATNTIAGSANFTWDNTAKSLTVSTTGASSGAIYGLTAGVTTNLAAIVGSCQQLGNFYCEGGQFTATDSGAGPIGSVIGIAAVPSHLAVGTLATMTGLDVNAIVGGGAGAITTSRGIHVGGVSFPTGTTPVTQNGITIDDQCAGSFSAPTCIGLNIAAQSNSGVAASINGLLNATAGGAFSGTFTHSGAETHTGAEKFCILNGMYVAGSSCYATIQAAETAACAISPNGTVYIPATYAGADTFTYNTSCSAGYPSLEDLRRSANSSSTVYSVTYPSTDNMSRSLPLGADMNIYTAGSSDLHIKHGLVAATTAVSLAVGVNNNVLISSVTCPNCITSMPFTGTANLYIGASLIIGRETANEENVPTGSWSIVDATHLNITCANTHAGTTDVEQQMGSTFFDAGSEFIINPKAPAQSTHGSAARFFDGNGNLVFFYPGNSSDAWPYSGLQIFPPLTGASNAGVSAPADLRLKNSSSSFCTKMILSSSGNIASFCDTLVTITKNTSFFGGGNTIFYSDQGVTPKIQITGTTGAISFAGQITSTLAIGTAPFAITSTTPVANLTLSNHPLVEYCGATSGGTQACAKTQQTSPIIVYGDVTLNTATTQSITTLPFTDALYSCTGTDLTTVTGIVSFNTYASASVTIQESGGVNTDHLRYVCVGH